MAEEYKSKEKYYDDDLDIGLLDLLFPLPMLPIKGMVWLTKKLRKTAKEEMSDNTGIQEKLLELQMRYEIGEIDDEEYEKEEAQLMDKLEAISKLEEEEE